MGLFSPSQKLLQQMRKALEIVVQPSVSLNTKNVRLLFLNETRLLLTTEPRTARASLFEYECVAESADPTFSVTVADLVRESIENFDLAASMSLEIESATLFAECTSLITMEAITVLEWKQEKNCFSVETGSIDLLSLSGITIHGVEFSCFAVPVNELPTEALAGGENCVVQSVDFVRFQVAVQRFSFSPSVPDVNDTGPFPPTRPRTRLRVPRPPKLPNAPPEEKEPLEQCLRSLLFPPIEELLSDPQLALPELPYPYQVFGIKWLHDRKGALLADEMGLGKTMQAIIAARLLWREGAVKRILIICPKPLISNWRRELRTWWPGIECYTKSVSSNRKSFLLDATKGAVVKIINYESLAKELDWLKHRPPFHDLIVIDEAQRIKNAKAKNAQAVKALESRTRWALTGTPVENSQTDLVSIFGFVKSGLIRESDSLETIKSRTKPYILRRKQEEVLKDLPQKIDQDLEVELGERQREEYEQIEAEGVANLNQQGDKITVTHVFTLISKLRQICNFGSSHGESAKGDIIREELRDIAESKRKALVFGQLVEEPYGLKRLAKVLARFTPLQIHGGVPQKQRDCVIQTFEANQDSNVLLLNYATGGVGLNLQAANYVFLFDRWWNPAVEDQAVKRAHRLGQKLPVFVKRLYCKDTIEERIVKKLAEKRRIFTNIIGDEGNPAHKMGLTEEEFFGLFKGLRVRPARASETLSNTPLIMENMDAKDFENLVAIVYEKEGYKVRVIGNSHDGGIDIEAERSTAGGRDRVVIQCKRQKANVGRPVVQQLWGVVHSDQTITRCDLVTSAEFSSEARDFAAGKRINLVAGKDLKQRAERHGIAAFVPETMGGGSSVGDEPHIEEPPARDDGKSRIEKMERLIAKLDETFFPAKAGRQALGSRRRKIELWRAALASCADSPQVLYAALIERDPALSKDTSKVMEAIWASQREK